MPNFWSRGLQYLEEKFGAEITKDKDLEKMLIKIDKIEKGFASLRTVIQNFNSYFENFSTFFADLSNALELIYSNTPYYSIIEEFIVKQQIINIHIEDMSKLLNQLYSRSSEWDNIFNERTTQLKEREEKSVGTIIFESSSGLIFNLITEIVAIFSISMKHNERLSITFFLII